MADVDFFFDPVCPWAWITSRWVVEVASQRHLDVDWRFIALRIVNEDKDYEKDFSKGYVAAHGTSTIKNDRTEAKAIRHLFGTRARDVLVSSNKGQLGHTIAGAAVTNLICAIKAMCEGIVPPTANLTAQDPAIDLDCIPNQPRRAAVSAALINSFAFGGHNAVLAVRASS